MLLVRKWAQQPIIEKFIQAEIGLEYLSTAIIKILLLLSFLHRSKNHKAGKKSEYKTYKIKIKFNSC